MIQIIIIILILLIKQIHTNIIAEYNHRIFVEDLLVPSEAGDYFR